MNIYLILLILICVEVFNLSCQNNYINNVKNILTTKITSLMITLGYNCLYIYSLGNIQFNIIKNKINRQFILLLSYLKENKILTETIIINTFILIDTNGNEINKIFKNNVEFIELACKPHNYSGLFLMDKNNETKCVNNVFYTSFPTTFDYKLSNISFMSVELEHENKIYTINLKNNKYNYYIVNNCLNQLFFKYYIKNVLKTQINTDTFDYKLTIIDNNVNIITLLPNQYILILEDDYQIHPLIPNL
jgi:hypothetical protein